MGNGVALVITTNSPELGGATGEQSTKIVCINEDACLHREIHHLLGRVGTVELTLHLRVTIYLMAEVIQRVKQGLRELIHTASAGRLQRYSVSGSLSTKLHGPCVRQRAWGY